VQRAGYRVQAADTGARALHLARGKAFDALTLDLMLPEQGGLPLLASIRSDGPSSGSPVVGVSVPGSAGTAASFAIEDILCKPIRNEELVAAMARFRLPAPGRANVMVIDDDPLALDLMRATLKAIGIDSVCLQDGRQAVREMATHQPDAIILDLMMPGFDGFAVLDALQGLPECRETPVYIWTSMILTDEEYAILAGSAQAILSKGGGALAAMLERLRRWRPSVPALLHGAPE
jgi:CheY-like chemotaxis protein